MLDGERLGDHPAHRQAHHVRLFDAVGVEDGDRVIGHVGQQVGLAARTDRRIVEVGRQPDVAVVEPDDVEPAGDELLAPRLGVVDALAAESVDEEQRRIAGRAERLVVELAVTVACEGHGRGT